MGGVFVVAAPNVVWDAEGVVDDLTGSLGRFRPTRSQYRGNARLRDSRSRRGVRLDEPINRRTDGEVDDLGSELRPRFGTERRSDSFGLGPTFARILGQVGLGIQWTIEPAS